MNSVDFIYEFSEEVWSTPYSLMQEFKNRGWAVRRYHLSSMSNLDIDECLSNQADICIVMDWKGIDIPERLKSGLTNSFTIRENADTPQNFKSHLSVSKGYDLILTPDYESAVEYRKIGFNCIQFQHFADTTIHKVYYPKDNLPAKVRSTRGSGSSFVLDKLTQVMGPDKFLNKNGLYGEEYGKFLSSGLITVQHARHSEVTRRLFEGMSCGSMMLTDRLPKESRIDDIFTEGEDIVYYDSISQAISLINYYLSPEGAEERQRIAEEGMRLVHTYHTQKQRVDDILTEYFKKL